MKGRGLYTLGEPSDLTQGSAFYEDGKSQPFARDSCSLATAANVAKCSHSMATFSQYLVKAV